MKLRLALLSAVVLTVSLVGTSTTSAAVVTFTPNSLSDFQTSGDVIFRNSAPDGSGNSTVPDPATSTIEDPSTESPNQLRITSEITTGGFATYTHNMTGATFSPSGQGDVTSINFSITVNDPGIGNNGSLMGFGLEQGGNFYFYTEETGTQAKILRLHNSGDINFLTISKTGLDASDFGLFGSFVHQVDQMSNPDLSASGGDLQFVLYSTSQTSGQTKVRVADFHSMRVDVEFIPEPACMALLGLVGMMMRRCG